MPGPIGLLGGLEHYEPTLPIDRHMLDEVLQEGDQAQKQEAQRLIDSLPRSP